MSRTWLTLFVAAALTATGCAQDPTDQDNFQRESAQANTVTWCDGPDKVWAITVTSGVGIAVVGNHSECAR